MTGGTSVGGRREREKKRRAEGEGKKKKKKPPIESISMKEAQDKRLKQRIFPNLRRDQPPSVSGLCRRYHPSIIHTSISIQANPARTASDALCLPLSRRAMTAGQVWPAGGGLTECGPGGPVNDDACDQRRAMKFWSESLHEEREPLWNILNCSFSK